MHSTGTVVVVVILLVAAGHVHAQEEGISVKEWEVPTPNSAPHDIVVDSNGIVWFTEINANKIGMFDPAREQFREFDIPTPSSRPHGLVAGDDGNIWFTEYNAAKIGSYDPRTEEFQEYNTISTSSGPYAIWVDIYDNVWFSMTGAHKVGKFDQSTGTLHEYEMPTPMTTIRFIYADTQGNVWFPNDNNNKIGVITPSQEAGQQQVSQDGATLGTLKIVYIDVGQGSLNLIVFPNGKTMLIDGGERDASAALFQALHENDVNRLDLVVATHPHADHIGGLIDIIQSFEIGLVIDSGQIHTTQTFEDLLDTIEAKNIPVQSVREGDPLPDVDAPVDLEVLNPPTTLPDGAEDEDEFNNNSVAIKLTYRNFTALFTGDMEEASEVRLAAKKDIDVDVLTAGHHGSRSSSSDAFLNVVSPQVVIIAAGADNTYGHPHKEALDRITAAGTQHVLRTDLNGTITLTTTGDVGYTIETSNERIVVVPEFSATILLASISLILLFVYMSRGTIWKSLRQA